MSTWFSWAKAAPGVMVEVIDAADGKRTPWRAAGGHASGWKDEAVDAAPRLPPAGRPSGRSTDVRWGWLSSY